MQMEKLAAVQAEPKPVSASVRTVIQHHTTLRTEVCEPMVAELAALEAGLTGAEREAVQQYRLAVEGFFAAVADQARAALAR